MANFLSLRFFILRGLRDFLFLIVFSVVIVVVLNFFQPKSKTVKTKMVRDQKLVENADRIFKPFLARFPRCG